MKVTYKGNLLAESDETIVVEGNHYFPPESLNTAYFTESATHTVCPWKGRASYFHLKVGGEEIKDAAWYYPQPNEAAQHILGYVAFYKNKVSVA